MSATVTAAGVAGPKPAIARANVRVAVAATEATVRAIFWRMWRLQ